MFFLQNKKLILGAAAALALWLVVVFGFVQSNWSGQAQKKKETEENREHWDVYFTAKPGDKMLPTPEAEEAIVDSNKKLEENLIQLRRIEFGAPETLKTYTEATAGTGDHKNYFVSLRKTLEDKSNTQYNLKVPTELDLVAKADDPVSLNLIRLAMLDRLLVSCRDANVQRVTKIKYDAPWAIPLPEAAAPAGGKDPKAEAKFDPKGGGVGGAKANAEPSGPAVARLVQFPIHITLIGAERTVAQLLFEVQKPTLDNAHGYFCLTSLRVEVNDTASGTVKATLGLSALLNETTVNTMQIKLKNENASDSGTRKPDRDTERDGY